MGTESAIPYPATSNGRAAQRILEYSGLGVLAPHRACGHGTSVIQHRWRVRGQTELSSRQEAERARAKSAPTREAAAPNRTPESSGDRWASTGCSGAAGSATLQRHHVRLATAAAVDARQERTDGLRRDRAAARALRVVFPALQELRLELSFADGGSNAPAFQLHIMHPPARAFFRFPCPHADCSGQFDLSSAVNDASTNPAKGSEGVLVCSGLRPRTHDSKQPCQLQLSYRVTAKEHVLGD
jgi:hypothetical protein